MILTVCHYQFFKIDFLGKPNGNTELPKLEPHEIQMKINRKFENLMKTLEKLEKRRKPIENQ